MQTVTKEISYLAFDALNAIEGSLPGHMLLKENVKK